MDRLRFAAIVLLGMGEKCAADILKNLSPKEVQLVIEKINELDNVTESEVIKALNEFFKESSNNMGIDVISKESIKNSLVSAIGIKGIDGIESDKVRWVDVLLCQPMNSVADLIRDEHPQAIAALMIILSHQSGEKASALMKCLPSSLVSDVINRMAVISPISITAIDAFSQLFEGQFEVAEKYNVVSVDGVEAAASIISFLDSKLENEVIANLSNVHADLTDKIQDKLFPFERLADIDSRGLQVLLSEADSEDLVLALKGADDYVKKVFMKNMSVKSAEILKDEIESKGPVKLNKVMEAQKRLIILAKKLAEEEKLVLTGSKNNDIVM